MDGVVGEQMPGTGGDGHTWFLTLVSGRCGNGKLQNSEATGSSINKFCHFYGRYSMVFFNLVVGLNLFKKLTIFFQTLPKTLHKFGARRLANWRIANRRLAQRRMTHQNLIEKHT